MIEMCRHISEAVQVSGHGEPWWKPDIGPELLLSPQLPHDWSSQRADEQPGEGRTV